MENSVHITISDHQGIVSHVRFGERAFVCFHHRPPNQTKPNQAKNHTKIPPSLTELSNSKLATQNRRYLYILRVHAIETHAIGPKTQANAEEEEEEGELARSYGTGREGYWIG